MDNFKIKRPTKGRFVYVAGTEPVFHDQALIIDYTNTLENSRGCITEIWYNYTVDDWEYTFADDSKAFEHELVQSGAKEIIPEDKI